MPATNPKEAKLDDEGNKSVDLDISATQSALEDIDKCQNDLDSLNEKASDEIVAVEQKYNQLRRPHYEKRSKFIDGIPDFWYNVFINHPQVASMLSSGEQECLKCLKSVNVVEFADIKSGYKIILNFKENNFFTNSELVKEFHLIPFSSSKLETKSSTIEWKEGKDLTKLVAQGKGRKRQFGGHASFFSWFLHKGDPNMDDIAETIKDDIWVNPLQYYLASDIDISAENGISDDDDEDDLDESVVVIGDDDSDDEEDDDDDDEDGEDPEIYEVGDDEDDDDVEEIEGDDDEE